MLQVNISEAETRLHQLLNQVEQGEQVIITRQGKPIARLSPIQQTDFKTISSRANLRASQPLSKISTLETLQNLRGEARS